MAGVMGKLPDMADMAPADRAKLMELMKGLDGNIGDVMGNLSAQAILSSVSKYNDPAMPDKYFYWMIPNPFSDKDKNIEILVKRDTSKKGAPVTPEKTKMVIKMESDSFGDIGIIVDLSNKDVWYVFNSEGEEVKRYIASNAAVLRKQMDDLGFQVQGFSSQVQKLEIKKVQLLQMIIR